MFDFLIEGWAPITFPMTILLIIAVALIIRSLIVKPDLTKEQSLTQISYIKYLGILSLTIGLFGQILGLLAHLQQWRKLVKFLRQYSLVV